MTEGTAWKADGEFLILFGLYQEYWKNEKLREYSREQCP